MREGFEGVREARRRFPCKIDLDVAVFCIVHSYPTMKTRSMSTKYCGVSGARFLDLLSKIPERMKTRSMSSKWCGVSSIKTIPMDREVPLPAMKTRSMSWRGVSFPKSMDVSPPAENTPKVVESAGRTRSVLDARPKLRNERSSCRSFDYDWCNVAGQEEHMYPVISFDEASRCWTRNKTKLTHGTYKYNT